LAHRIRRGETRCGLATLCVGGGMGMAIALEKL
jgi:acetyl-CoA acetyltransferase